MVFFDLVIFIVVAVKDKGFVEKLGMVLSKMVQEDLFFRVEIDVESNEIIIKGMGELYLDIKVDILKWIYGVDVEVGKLQVVYCEFIIKFIEDSYIYKK